VRSSVSSSRAIQALSAVQSRARAGSGTWLSRLERESSECVDARKPSPCLLRPPPWPRTSPQPLSPGSCATSTTCRSSATPCACARASAAPIRGVDALSEGAAMHTTSSPGPTVASSPRPEDVVDSRSPCARARVDKRCLAGIDRAPAPLRAGEGVADSNRDVPGQARRARSGLPGSSNLVWTS